MKLATGRVVSITVAIASAPILARLYSPENFGLIALLTAAVALLRPLSHLAYVQAIPQARDVNEKRTLTTLVLLITVTMTVLLMLLLPLVSPWIAEKLGAKEFSRFSWLIPVLFFLAGVSAVVGMLLSTEKRFGDVAKRNALSTVATRITQILAGATSYTFSATGLILGALAGAFVQSFSYARAALKSIKGASDVDSSWKSIASVVSNRKDFPKFHFWSIFLNGATMSMPMLMLGWFFTPAIVGLYAVVTRLLMMPISVFSQTSGTVLFIEASERNLADGDVAKPVMEILKANLALTSMPFCAVMLLGPFIFEWFLGEQWREAGVYGQILAPWLALSALGGPLTSMFIVKQKMARGLNFNIALLIVRFSALLLGGLFFGPRVTLMFFVGGSILVWGVLIKHTAQLSGLDTKNLIRIITIAYANATLYLLPAAVLFYLGYSHSWTGLLLLSGCLLYCIRSSEVKEILGSLTRKKNSDLGRAEL